MLFVGECQGRHGLERGEQQDARDQGDVGIWDPCLGSYIFNKTNRMYYVEVDGANP